MDWEFPPWLGGVGLCLIGSTMTSAGLVMQKHSHRQNEDLGFKGVAYYWQKWWVAGFSVFLLAQIVNAVSMALAPQVVVSCLGSWSLACNAVLAHLCLGENLGHMEILAVVGLVLAAVLVVLGTPAAQKHTTGDVRVLTAAFFSNSFMVLSSVIAGVLAFLAITGHRRWQESRPHASMWAIAAAIGSGYTSLFVRCITLMAFANPPDAPRPWYTVAGYVISSGAGISGMAQVHCLNHGLRNGDAVVVVPMFLSLGMLAQMLIGGVFFDEMRQIESAAQITIFIIGVVLLIVAVGMLALANAASSAQKPTPQLPTKLPADKLGDVPPNPVANVPLPAPQQAVASLLAANYVASRPDTRPKRAAP